MLIPIEIPPGVVRLGTDYQSGGRWYNTNLVRWTEGGIMQPVGGWQQRGTTSVSGKCRGLLTWRDNSNDRYIALGTHTGLYVMNEGASLYNITPAGYVAGAADATINQGYGGGFFGSGFYGTPRINNTSVTPATTWTLDNWGQNLIACTASDGKIYEWSLNTANPAVAVTNAPVGNRSAVVTSERFLFALGAGGNGRKVQWSDQENNTVWTATPTNQAGDILLETQGSIVCGKRVRGQTVIWTDVDVHTATYQGPPYVYGFERIGSGCGVVSSQAVAVVDARAFWMGANGFWIYDGYVKPVECSVQDYVFKDINRFQASKVYAVHNSSFSEIWWFYPSEGSNEIDRYVGLNYRDGSWIIGQLARTAGTGQGVYPFPIMIGTDGTVYDHEIGLNYGGATVFAEAAPLEIGNGDRLVVAKQLIPDEKTAGDIQVTFKTKLAPDDSTERTYSYTISDKYVPVRFTGRQVAIRVTGARLADWRWGKPRIDAIEGSAR